MRKILGLCLLLLANGVVAQTCPIAKSLPNLPTGWHYVEGDSGSKENYYFSVAAWGDHKSGFSRVRCHYYNKNEDQHIQIESDGAYPEMSVSAWTNLDLYHLCVSREDDVNKCVFN